jgi:hypothetical protein
MQLFVIKFVNDLRHIGCSLRGYSDCNNKTENIIENYTLINQSNQIKPCVLFDVLQYHTTYALCTSSFMRNWNYTWM